MENKKPKWTEIYILDIVFFSAQIFFYKSILRNVSFNLISNS